MRSLKEVEDADNARKRHICRTSLAEAIEEADNARKQHLCHTSLAEAIAEDKTLKLL